MNEPKLPPHWEKRIDSRTGWPYYLNHLTQTTQWEAPQLETSGNINNPATVPPDMSTNSHQTGHEGTADSSSLRTESGSNVSDGSESSLATIISIRSDAESIHGKIEAFTSGKSSKEYKYLEEMMIRHLCKLDSVEANGDEAIRQKRKDAVNYIQSCLDQLELKAFANETQIE